MDVGTTEITDDLDRGTSGGSTPGSGGGGNDPSGGNDQPGKGDSARAEPFVPGKSRILTGFLLVVVMMTFGGLMAAYVVIATNNVAEWKPFDLPIQVWISTGLILISSAIYHFGKLAVDRNDQPSAKKWFIITTVFGAAFISSQTLAWFELNARGLYVQGNPYVGFFFILTAVHAVHVLGGIVALGSILLRNLVATDRLIEIEKRRTIAQVVGWYWHFMGSLWIALFVMLGFWK
jgi:cytochrome c oxidase subunit III